MPSELAGPTGCGLPKLTCAIAVPMSDPTENPEPDVPKLTTQWLCPCNTQIRIVHLWFLILALHTDAGGVGNGSTMRLAAFIMRNK